MKYFEKYDPEHLDRILITLAIFCSASKHYMKAEGLYRKVLDMLEESDSYNKVLALQMYGKLLKKMPNRQKEGESNP